MTVSTPNEDPKELYIQPPHDEKPQEYPGSEAAMNIKPDYGRESYKGSGRMAGRKALVTGADSGIGRAVALAFAREGADVAISYLPEEEEDAREIMEALKETGRTVAAIPGDLKDESFARGLAMQAHDALGGLDVLVNNAGYQKYFETFTDIPTQDFEDILRTNVLGTFWLTQAAVPLMQPGSAVINTVSIQAYEPTPMLLPYSVSKGALVTFTKGLAQELVDQGIRVNAVAPGPIWSPLNTHGSPPEKLKKFGDTSSFGRPGQPVELAPVYVLLASSEGSYINGEIYGVTGGKGVA